VSWRLARRILLSVVLAAGIALVFRAYLTPDHLLDWLASSGLCG
jgi:uncharacterized protein YndB with AHSA1/START domain